MAMDYEKIGGVIYGTGRLRFVLTSLSQWFAKENGDHAAPDGQRVDLAAAICFFQRNPVFSAIEPEYSRIFHAFNALQDVVANLARKTSAEIDAHLAEIQQLHGALAQVVDDLGYIGSLSTYLRR